VAGFLRAAEAVITEIGYDRATMSAIAERANSSIGSLYQFFPNKKAVAEALRVHCIQEVEHRWRALAGEAGGLSTEELADQLVAVQLEIVKAHPALLALLDVPPGTITSKWREVIRKRMAAVLIAHKPRLSQPAALRIAGVVQQVSRGLLMLYGRTDADQKAFIVEEFKCVLKGYLASKFHG
jgi:AcrR family transcriptional regulator